MHVGDLDARFRRRGGRARGGGGGGGGGAAGIRGRGHGLAGLRLDDGVVEEGVERAVLVLVHGRVKRDAHARVRFGQHALALHGQAQPVARVPVDQLADLGLDLDFRAGPVVGPVDDLAEQEVGDDLGELLGRLEVQDALLPAAVGAGAVVQLAQRRGAAARRGGSAGGRGAALADAVAIGPVAVARRLVADDPGALGARDLAGPDGYLVELFPLGFRLRRRFGWFRGLRGGRLRGSRLRGSRLLRGRLPRGGRGMCIDVHFFRAHLEKIAELRWWDFRSYVSFRCQ